MTASRTVLALAAAAALGSGFAWSPLAQAQPSTATPPSATMAAPSATAPSAATARSTKGSADKKVEARITQLHKELKITPAQESEWNTVAQDMRDNAQKMSSLIEERSSEAKGKHMTAVENLKSYEEIAEAHVDGLKKIAPDFDKLYDSMTPAQKKTADNIFNQRINHRVHATASPSSGKQG